MTDLTRRSFLVGAALSGGALLLAACGGGMGGMDHGSGKDNYDQNFIDGMVPHHQAAIAMAEIAQGQGEHAEIRQLANDIVSAQDSEIAQLKGWRKAWYGSDTIPPGNGGHAMAGMDTDLKQLAAARPFDKAFIDAMIPHHQSAIDMTQEAQQQAQHQEIKGLAGQISAAQQREIDQLKGWRAQWYPGQ